MGKGCRIIVVERFQRHRSGTCVTGKAGSKTQKTHVLLSGLLVYYKGLMLTMVEQAAQVPVGEAQIGLVYRDDMPLYGAAKEYCARWHGGGCKERMNILRGMKLEEYVREIYTNLFFVMRFSKRLSKKCELFA